VAISILAIGWSIAAAVYLAASPVAFDADAYDLQHSRKYVREVEVLGGKTALLTNELNTWVAGLWHGTKLAYTIAVITVGVAATSWLFMGASESSGTPKA
jgi:hypothetical protein